MLILTKFYRSKKKYLKISLGILIFSFFIMSFALFLFPFKQKGYSFFLEFNNSYGLKEGTSVNYKGVKIGFVNRISVHLNKVVVLLSIDSSNVLIPSSSIFEANQIGLFNDIVVSINSSDYLTDNILCNSLYDYVKPYSYIKGYKGINYNDLIRSTTRISQRFDDPRFFSLFYLLLKNGIYLSDEILTLTYNMSNCFYLFFDFTTLMLYQYIF
uniref:Mce/MlaD domain-containing protein n=1 Tax=Polysiphonia sertularioides TaxID=945028 RepID=A0A1Z1M975_9FLOR|nr:hypothetical protein [Polysiphonia sertularioides]ARW62443.1 hypothetical protein [Polysiphonia sertularioides]